MIKYEVKVYNDGNKYWYLNGKSHREDGPAIEYANGDKKWYLDDTLHREDGPAVEYDNGTKAWYLNGKCHREDGPAMKFTSGDKYWYLNDKLHRVDGPAIVHADGTKAWCLKGKELTEKEHHIRTLPTVKTASSKPMFEVSEIRENSHDGSATLVIDMSPEMSQIVLTKGINAILRDALDDVEGWTG